MILKCRWNIAIMAFCFLWLLSAACIAEQKIGTLTTTVTTDYSYPTCTLTVPTTVSLGTKIAGSGVSDGQSIDLSISCDGNVSSSVKVIVVKGSLGYRNKEIVFLNSQNVSSDSGISAELLLSKGSTDTGDKIAVDGSQGICKGDASRTCKIYTSIFVDNPVHNPAVSFGKATAAIKLNLEYD